MVALSGIRPPIRPYVSNAAAADRIGGALAGRVLRIGPSADRRPWPSRCPHPGGTMAVAVAAPHPAAVGAARETVARGGNAFDAVLAAAGALTVAYPHQCSAGGDLVAIVRPAGRTPVAVLSIGAAAAAVDVAAL